MLFPRCFAQSPDTKAAAPSYHRPCKADDLPGTWKVVKWTCYFKPPEKDIANVWFHDDQWCQFTGDGKMKSASAMKGGRLLDAKAFERLPVTRSLYDRFKVPLESGVLEKLPAVIAYACETDGRVVVTRTDLQDHREIWFSNLITENRSEPTVDVFLEKGDLLMTILNAQGKPAYLRQLRRLPE
ncbi:MAG: hypothetical protein HY360_08185 [Verrucomicrobia bacterium]|nr:hypothetical protein [Verrucomicrobiota bacterium]